jgi:hypothetical protein
MIKVLHNREITAKKNKTVINKILDERCKKEIKNNKFDIFNQYIDLGIYEIKLLVDNRETYEIYNSDHKIDIMFINNLINEIKLIETIYLLRMTEDSYLYVYKNANINFNISIQRGTRNLEINKIFLDDLQIINKIIQSHNSYILLLILEDFIIFSFIMLIISGSLVMLNMFSPKVLR